MNTEQLEFLATEVMGWGQGNNVVLGKVYTKDLSFHIEYGTWQPHKNIDQAMMLLEKASKDGWTLYNDGDEYDCYVGYKHQHTSNCKCEAICEAVLKFKDYNEELK